MKFKFSIVTLLLTAILSQPLLAETQSSTSAATKTSSSGPEIKVDKKHFLEGKEDEEGLKRLGQYGNLHFFGYGELHYNDNVGGTPNQIDFHRLVIGLGYDFTEALSFKMELDFEHAFKEPELEFAYIDYQIKNAFNLRGGAILVPMGVLNQHHEPPLFNSVERPQVYHDIIPSSWQGAGAGLHGKFDNGFEYEAYGLSSLTAITTDDGALDDSFSGSEGFHDDHSIGEAPGRDFGFAVRLAYKGIKGLRIGTSTFLGNTAQGNGDIGSGFLTMLEGDAKYSFCGIDLETLLVYTHLSDAGNLNTEIISMDPTFNDFVATSMLGYFFEAGYHILPKLVPETNQDLILFGRYERVNTQLSMPTGFASSGTLDRNIVTFGVNYLPIPQLAIKADYNARWNDSNGDVDQFNLGLGFYY